ncbi:branched-chain amino acid ABC transporter permease [Calidifontibacter sp. DB0510]|uniref:Branched-chain amino acid ABC transporter permease n=1 Tax=Metallococcus carri TaxID=1656884 RepID=A0A967B3L0_9MICO|nr:branched-chain amino acid ABC transporter permease [Metallococcus carri]NHN56908.1 branched-chain amino acid ABC transporter permease [Metallococcus carri]NOP37653.1 branched-chain amino acid ABC transporter permease [Calidifontibacter sp. DB2511S]
MSETVAAPITARPAGARKTLLLKTIGALALGVVVFLLPLYLSSQYLLVLMWVFTGAVGAMGLTMLIGQAGQLSLAHSFFVLVGGVSYAVYASPGDKDTIGFGLPTLLALVLAVVTTGLVGALFAPISGRLRGIYLGVASLSLVFLGFWLANQLPSIAGSASSGRYAPSLKLPGFDFGEQNPSLYVLNVEIGSAERSFWLFAALTALAYVAGRGALSGRVGRGWRAVRDNEAMATVMGVSVVRQKATAFAVSSAYAGLAGVMVVWWYSGLMKPDEAVDFGTYGTTVAISYLAMCVIGGLGSLGGSILGAAIVFGLPQLLPLLNGSTSAGSLSGTAFTPVVITNLIFGALIVLIIMFEPRGFAGLGQRIVRLVRR